MASQIDTAQRRAAVELMCKISHQLGMLTNYTVADFEREDVYPLSRGHIERALQQARREALEEAAKAQCMYCNDPGWEPMSNSGYHQCRESGPSLMRCRATAIHELLDRLREGVEG